jgi:phosphoribosylformylglycinamidine cyclo-ligase
MSDTRYSARGVSASKEDVHKAIQNLDKGLFPNAFCKIIPDILGNDPAWCNIMHADGAGTKSAWHTFTGRKPATSVFGKTSPRTLS